MYLIEPLQIVYRQCTALYGASVLKPLIRKLLIK